VITEEATNTGHQISGAKIMVKTISIKITIGIITITGTEIGKLTDGIIIAGVIITGTTIRILTDTINIIITTIITGMLFAGLFIRHKSIFTIIPGIIVTMDSFSGTSKELVTCWLIFHSV
jgi:hypothetical protein